MTERPPPPSASTPPPLRRVALHAVASGLTPLIPLPYLDELALRQVREKLVRALLEEKGLPTPPGAVATLAGSHQGPGAGGRVVSYLKSLALLPVRRIFRKALFVLWVKDCVDVASQSLHHGYLLQHALARGDLDARSLEGSAPARVHDAIAAACREVDPRPVNQVLRRLFASSRVLMGEAARALVAGLRRGPRTPEPGEQAEVSSLTERLLAALREERGYFAALEQRYEAQLAARPAATER